MDLLLPDIILLKFLARYSVADIDGIRTIYAPYGGKRYYEDRISRLRAKGVKYISLRNRQSDYVLLTHGRQVLKEMGMENAAWYSGSHKSLSRLEAVSRLAVLLMQAGVNVLADMPVEYKNEPVFIPSSIIKARIGGIDRQSRFAGMLYCAGGNFAVYDLGDGSHIWQPMSEASLFKDDLRKDFSPDGMLLMVDDQCIADVTARITITDIYNSRSSNMTGKNKKQPLRLWPGYKRCCLAGKKDTVLILKLLSSKEWKKQIQYDLFPGVDLVRGSPVEPDICSQGCDVYLFVDNDMLRAHLLKQYFEICPEETPDKQIQLLCMENYLPVFSRLFPEKRVIPIRTAKLERILTQGGEKN